jgi:osmotically-inducible protein OsmY
MRWFPRDRITVKVEHGVVTSRGEVDWQFQRAEADYDVHKLGSVKAVVNDIVVAAKVHPEDVHAMIRVALERHAEIEAGNIRGQRCRRQGHRGRHGLRPWRIRADGLGR